MAAYEYTSNFAFSQQYVFLCGNLITYPPHINEAPRSKLRGIKPERIKFAE